MIPVDGSVKIYVATQPVDFRRGVTHLMGLIAYGMQHNGCSGDVYIFRNRIGDKVRLLFHDGSGVILATKWLDRGRFTWPAVKDGAMVLSAPQCAALLSGLDWKKLPFQEPRRPKIYC